MRFRRDGRRIAAALSAWYGSLRKVNQIAVWVVAVHSVAVFWMMVDHLVSHKPVHRPIVVRTVRPQAEKPMVASLPAKKTEAPIAKVKPAVVAPKKKPAAVSQKKPVEKKKESASFEKIDQSLAALSQPVKARKSELILPSAIQNRGVEASVQTTEPYGEWLVDALQRSLQLPEIGDVKARLTLRSSGLIEKVEILQAKSEKNADWLKKQLPLLELPCFNDFGIASATLEFTITFRNVENY